MLQVILYQDFGLVLVKPSEAPATPFLQPVENFRFLSASPPAYLPYPGLVLLAGLLRVIQVINRDVKQYGSQYLSLRDTVINQPTVGLHTHGHTTPWAQQSCQFSTYSTICVSNPWLTYLGTRVLWETMSKALQSVVQSTHHKSQSV